MSDKNEGHCPLSLVNVNAIKPYFNKYFDLAISIEVAEHLPESAADNFVSMIVSSANVVLFSAAIKGQGGLGSVDISSKLLISNPYDERQAADFWSYINRA